MVRDIPGFPVGVVRVQHFAQVYRRFRVPHDCVVEITRQAQNARVLAGRTDPDSDDCVLRTRRNHRNVQVEII